MGGRKWEGSIMWFAYSFSCNPMILVGKPEKSFCGWVEILLQCVFWDKFGSNSVVMFKE